MKRRSKPIVDEAFELIALPQSEPATWPGKTSTPSGSSSSRRSEWKSPSAPSFAPTARSGRAASPTKSESPVSTSQGSSARAAVDHREAGVLGPVAGRVDRAQDDCAELDLDAVLERRRAGTRPRRPDGSRSGRRARAPAGRGRRGGRRACASRRRGRSRRRAWPPSASTGSTAYGGSTTAATPASSSPTRYDAQPRSSSRNCWNSTRRDAIRLSGARTAARARRGRPRGACRRRLRPRGTPDRLGAAGTTVIASVDLDRLAVGEHRAQDESATHRLGPARRRAPARSNASRRHDVPASRVESTLSPVALDLEPSGGGPAAAAAARSAAR